MTKIVIIVSGGIVSEVISDQVGIEFTVIDLDVMNANFTDAETLERDIDLATEFEQAEFIKDIQTTIDFELFAPKALLEQLIKENEAND